MAPPTHPARPAQRVQSSRPAHPAPSPPTPHPQSSHPQRHTPSAHSPTHTHPNPHHPHAYTHSTTPPSLSSHEDDTLRRIHAAQALAEALMKDFTPLIKAIIYIGSLTRGEQKEESDTDLLIILDDTLPLDKDVLQAYTLRVNHLVEEAHKNGMKFHITTLRLTAFWDMLRNGDPILTTMLRDGYALIDTGFFDPLKRLLQQGRIRPSPEAISTYAIRAVQSLGFAEASLQKAVRDAYWSIVNATHAYLMSKGEKPSLPKDMPSLLKKHAAFLTPHDVTFIRNIIREEKLLEHGKTTLQPRDVIRTLRDAERIVKKILKHTLVNGKPVIKV